MDSTATQVEEEFNFMIYWKFMNHAKLDERQPTMVDIAPDFVVHTAICTAVFVVLMYLVPLILKTVCATWYNSLADKKKEEVPAYLSSMLHHLTVVPMAWFFIYHDFVTAGSNPADLTLFLRFAIPFCTGFIFADTIFFAIPLATRGNMEYIIHHILAVWMIYTLFTGSGHFFRYFPHIIICDTTNAVFNIAWFLRLTGWKDSSVVSGLEILFAVLFFFLRVINLTVVFGIMFFHSEGVSFGLGRYAFPLISAMQFYWAFKIVQAMFKKLAPSKGGKPAKITKAATATGASAKKVE